MPAQKRRPFRPPRGWCFFFPESRAVTIFPWSVRLSCLCKPAERQKPTLQSAVFRRKARRPQAAAEKIYSHRQEHMRLWLRIHNDHGWHNKRTPEEKTELCCSWRIIRQGAWHNLQFSPIRDWPGARSLSSVSPFGLRPLFETELKEIIPISLLFQKTIATCNYNFRKISLQERRSQILTLSSAAHAAFKRKTAGFYSGDISFAPVRLVFLLSLWEPAL